MHHERIDEDGRGNRSSKAEDKGEWVEGRRKVLMRVGLSQNYALSMTRVEIGDDGDCRMGHVGFKTWLQHMGCALACLNW